MPEPRRRILEQLAEAHALESERARTLGAHVALTPRSEYREVLERHVVATRAHAERLAARMGELGRTRSPLGQALVLAQAALAPLAAAGRLPLELLRGMGGEERLLRNAREEAAAAALAIATYDALEALAAAAGDDGTAALAREQRDDGERFLADVRGAIPQLARDLHAADLGDERPPPPPAADVQAAAKEAADEVRAGAGRRRAPGRSRRP